MRLNLQSPGRRALALGALLLGLAGCAAGPPPAPPVGRAAVEAGYLHRYVLLVCMGAAYGRLQPPDDRLVEMLQAEAWVFVEKGAAGPETYDRLHTLATDAGQAIPPQAAVRGCLDWSRRPDVAAAVHREAQRAAADR